MRGQLAYTEVTLRESTAQPSKCFLASTMLKRTREMVEKKSISGSSRYISTQGIRLSREINSGERSEDVQEHVVGASSGSWGGRKVKKRRIET